MTSRSRTTAVTAAGLGLAVLIVWLAITGTGVGTRDEPDQSEVTAKRARRSAAGSSGVLRARPVDPASRGYEGRETERWDELTAAERVVQVEVEVKAKLEKVAIAASASEAEEYRRDAKVALSAARADFWALGDGAARYTVLEQAIEETER